MGNLKREYLEDYSQKERAEFNKLETEIREGKFSFERDRYPRDARFFKLQEPVAVTVGTETANWESIWAQIPFSGSLIVIIPPTPQQWFEKIYFKVSEIPEIIDYVKKTGRLQIVLNDDPIEYSELDFMEPIFRELNPPYYHGAPSFLFGTGKELAKYDVAFSTLAAVRFFDFLRRSALHAHMDPRVIRGILIQFRVTYALLKAGRYSVAEEIDKLLIHDPTEAFIMLCACRDFIVDPITDLRSNLRNYGLEGIRRAQNLPSFNRPEPRFPNEIGKFLIDKLAYAPKGLRACNQLIDDYDAYDLRKVQSALNDGIVANCPDIVDKQAKEFSEILDNVWSDKTIPNRIKNIKIGIPVSIAAVGSVAGAITGGLVGAASGAGMGDFLCNLGFKVGEKVIEKFFNVQGAEITEKIAQLRTMNYQATIYDFQKEYEDRIRA